MTQMAARSGNLGWKEQGGHEAPQAYHAGDHTAEGVGTALHSSSGQAVAPPSLTWATESPAVFHEVMPSFLASAVLT